PVDVEREQAEEVAVWAQVVGRRERAVVAEPVTGQRVVAGKPAGVVVQSLPRTGRAGWRALAMRGDAVAAAAGLDHAQVGGQVDHRPVAELAAWLVDRDLDARLVDHPGVGRRIAV